MKSKIPSTYFCTRPILAARLIAKGHKPDCQPNPWNPSLTAWVFPMSQELCEIVRDFHQEIGKDLPHFITEYLKGGNENA